MKKYILLALSFLVTTIHAQENAKSFLEVDYEMTMNLDPDEVINNVPKQWRAQVEDQLRQELKDGVKIDYKLKSNGFESEYEMQAKISNGQGGGGMIAQQIMAQDKGIFYKNLTDREYKKSYAIASQSYVVVDSLPEYKWNITREKDQIAGFEVRKANGVLNDSTTIVAWFAPKLKFKDGPDRAWGLPGLILKSVFEVKGNEVILMAKNVAVQTEEIKIRQPKGGKELSQKEFEQAMLDFQKKMREMYGGGVDTE